MALRTKVESLDRDVKVIIDDLLSPAAQSAAFADFAREALAEAEATNQAVLGSVPPHKTFVDGADGASEDQVRPGGTIVYEFQLVLDLLAWVDAALFAHSPNRSGRYARSHLLYADGVEIDPAAEIPSAQEYVFINTQPYSRKIEGIPKERPPQSSQAPDGVYQAVAMLAKGRFGNIAKIKFDLRAPLGGASALETWARATKLETKKHRRRQRSYPEWLRRQPAIVITLK